MFLLYVPFAKYVRSFDFCQCFIAPCQSLFYCVHIPFIEFFFGFTNQNALKTVLFDLPDDLERNRRSLRTGGVAFPKLVPHKPPLPPRWHGPPLLEEQ